MSLALRYYFKWILKVAKSHKYHYWKKKQNKTKQNKTNIGTSGSSPSNYVYNFYCPLLEYAGGVWDNCTLADSERLEEIQLKDSRTGIVTDLTSFASLLSIYKETGWENFQ